MENPHIRHDGKAISSGVMAGRMTLRGARKLTLMAKGLWMIPVCSNR
jgi:hypothetical protein